MSRTPRLHLAPEATRRESLLLTTCQRQSKAAAESRTPCASTALASLRTRLSDASPATPRATKQRPQDVFTNDGACGATTFCSFMSGPSPSSLPEQPAAFRHFIGHNSNKRSAADCGMDLSPPPAAKRPVPIDNSFLGPHLLVSAPRPAKEMATTPRLRLKTAVTSDARLAEAVSVECARFAAAGGGSPCGNCAYGMRDVSTADLSCCYSNLSAVEGGRWGGGETAAQ